MDRMTPEQFSFALRLTESGNNPKAYGDNGLALTSYQIHPAWLWDRIQTTVQIPRVGEDWESWIDRIVEEFYDRHSLRLTDVEVAMLFHRGHETHYGYGDWDVAYADRFQGFADRIMHGDLAGRVPAA